MATDARLLQINIEDEMRTAFLDYAMSVIIARALPDVRDGLKPVQRRVTAPKQTERRRDPQQAALLVVVLPGSEGDVVPEPLGLLVRVCVTTDVDEQRRVVDGRPLGVVEPEPVGETESDEALSQHVLHRLAEAEVDAERQRGDELRQSRLVAPRHRSRSHTPQSNRQPARLRA